MGSSTIWQKLGLHNWFLKKENRQAIKKTATLTPNDVYKYIVEKFEESIAILSFANRIVFYHEYIICFNPEDYDEFMENKKGIFGLIIQESVKRFYAVLKEYRVQGKNVEPASNKWIFRFVSNPDYPRGDKSFIGKLLPGNFQQEQGNLRVTYIPRQTGIAESFDVNPDILEGFTFYSEGYYEVPYQENLVFDENKIANSNTGLIARFEAIVPDKEYSGKKIQYFMKDKEIIISGIDEQRKEDHIFRIPSDWVNTPHLCIRYNDKEARFYLSSFGEKTIVNELEVSMSTNDNPSWMELPLNSRIVLNGIVGINIYKS